MRLFLTLCLICVMHIGFTQVKQQPSKGVYQFMADSRHFDIHKPSVYGEKAMVASAHPVASQVGVDILKQGGNAIDAAIAVHFALAVVYPSAGNLGGGGFMLTRLQNGTTLSLDFREKAPARSHRDMYLDTSGNVIDQLSFRGPLASGVPGAVDGMEQAHKKLGTLPWKTLLQPAIDIAKKGVILTDKEAAGLNAVLPRLLKYNPGTTYFQKDDKQPWKKGDTLRQPDLAKTLILIQKKGRDGFYKGKTAQLLSKQFEQTKGIITEKDLKSYKAVWRTPIEGTYKKYKIISMAPPSSGGVALLQLLGLIEPYPLHKWGWHSDSTLQVMIEAERRVYADRAKFIGDPDFVKIPVPTLISKPYLASQWKNFQFEKATPSNTITGGNIPEYESPETTHFSIVDAAGNAVAVTTTLNDAYGSGVIINGAGFLMNNEMDDFSIKPGVPNAYGLIGNNQNAIAPHKRMLSSMTPTIVEKDGKLFLVVGTPGGSTIITSVFQTIVNVIEHGMTMQEAVNAYKFHHQWLPDKVLYEEGAFTSEVQTTLRNKGYHLELQGTLGRMDCIRILPDGKLEGASDPRADNTSIGY